MNIEVAKREGGAWQAREDTIGCKRPRVVRVTLGAIGVNEGESGGSRVEKSIRSNKIQSHDAVPIERMWQKGNGGKKSTKTERATGGCVPPTPEGKKEVQGRKEGRVPL